MSKTWLSTKYQDFARDVFRDFCLAGQGLEAQFQEFSLKGKIDFSVIRDLMGEETNKGLLWRLKDTAHHLFRINSDNDVMGRLLDWSLGYIFHETMKLKENAYQVENYSTLLQENHFADLPEPTRSFSRELSPVLEQTRESIEREISRIRFIMDHCRAMFPLYYARHRENPLFARFLFDQNELVREVFQESYAELISIIYNHAPEEMYILAAQSLRRGGWLAEASTALDQALAIRPDSPEARMERELLDLASNILSGKKGPRS
ncbi:MAG: hypothetical protein D6E12_00235 [Desulfovibrio sp.]|nr:MAG: hypothetical protein D6E12_00235 [Desulfovibrio sp.]